MPISSAKYVLGHGPAMIATSQDASCRPNRLGPVGTSLPNQSLRNRCHDSAQPFRPDVGDRRRNLDAPAGIVIGLPGNSSFMPTRSRTLQWTNDEIRGTISIAGAGAGGDTTRFMPNLNEDLTERPGRSVTAS